MMPLVIGGIALIVGAVIGSAFVSQWKPGA
jgi:hypothetical protein